MKGDIPAAALRLAIALPVRTHLAPEPEPRKIGQPKNPGVGRGMNQVTQIGLRFRGKTFASLSEARKVLRCSYRTIEKLTREGKAEYV